MLIFLTSGVRNGGQSPISFNAKVSGGMVVLNWDLTPISNAKVSGGMVVLNWDLTPISNSQFLRCL